MRTPLWILDFNEGNMTAAFLERWWRAYSLNSSEKPDEQDKWYHISSCSGKTFEEILWDAGHLTIRRDGVDPLIPLFGGIARQDTLNVVFMGDITDEKCTIPNFHFWAARLRKSLLSEDSQWTTVPCVNFYGMLWRPATAAVAPGVSAKTRGFLQELNLLMKQDVNHAPFRSVSFIESSDRSEDRTAAFEQMNLAALYLTAEDYLGDVDYHRFVDLKATGVFYEASVHAEQGEFVLSNALVDRIAHSREPEFYDKNAAASFVDSNQDFLGTFAPETLGALLTDECPHPNGKTYAYDIKPGISPWSTKLRKVWAEYYCDYIPNYKKNLVNRVKRSLKSFVRDFKEKLYHNQKKVVSTEAAALQKQVFRIFEDTSSSKFISLAQAEEILAVYKKRIEDAAQSQTDVKIQPFAIPSELKGAAKQAEAENRTPEEALAVLEDKISHHPVAVFALLIRALVLGFLCSFIAWRFLPEIMDVGVALVLTTVLGILPLVVALLKFRVMRIRVEALKQQYVGVMLLRAEEELRTEILACLKVTYQELLQYCDWLKQYKIHFLQEHLSVLPPSTLSFIESSVLQPLVKAGTRINEEENVVLIPPVAIDAYDDVQFSGSFGRKPLLNFDDFSSTHKICIDGNDYDVKAVIRNSHLLSILVKDLMSARAKVRRSIERAATFSSKDIKGKTLLLLDISGSMGGQKLEDLKKAVHNLEESYSVDWIAFSDDVVSSSFDDYSSIDSLEAVAGTQFIPPIILAAEKLKEDVYDDVILISDGCPFEKTEDILEAAYQLQQPLNTISIGKEGSDVMKELSDKTSGIQIVVDDVKEIVRWEGKMQTIVQLGATGEFSFGELIAKCHIPGCAQALKSFSSERIDSEAVSLSNLISRYPGKGIAEWAIFTRRGSELTQTAELLDDQLLLGVDTDASRDRAFVSTINQQMQENALSIQALEGPLMLATLVSMRGLSLKDFLWAGLDERCADLNDREQLASLLFGSPSICNLYNKPIR